MKDPQFITERITRGKQALQKVQTELSALTQEQFNWKPAANSWSVAECLEHLRVADSFYFADLEAIANGTYRMSSWERYSPLSGLFGRLLKDAMKEDVKRKTATHSTLTPASSTYELSLLDLYIKNLNRFMELTGKCSDADLDKCIINSPTLRWITYSLRDALQFLFEHEHRHINQAIRVKQRAGFPKN